MTLQIFKATSQPDGHGTVMNFTPAMIAGAAASYDPSIHEAPIVLGHPRTDSPAYGWIGSVMAKGELMLAEARQVHAEFAQAVANGSWKKISSAFYLPGSPNHPIPGSPFPYLKHVGFLGGTPPVIKGMASAEFAEVSGPEEGVFYAEMGDGDGDELMTSLGMALQNLREYILEKDGRESADQVLPQSLIEAVRASADELQDDVEEAGECEPTAMAMPGPMYAEGKKPEPCPTCGQMPADPEAAPMAKTKKPVDAAYAEREQGLADRERKIQTAELTQYCESLIREGRAGVAGVLKHAVALMLSPTGSDVIQFGEGASAVSGTQVEHVKALLNAIPKTVTFGEAAPRSTTASPPKTMSTEEIAKAAQKRAKEMGISTAEAVRQINYEMENQ